MKKSLFYIFMALVCAACTLAGCRKDEANKAPEGVFWFNEGANTEEIPGAIMYKDGISSVYAYAATDEGAAALAEETGKPVKKGNMVYMIQLGTYTITRNEDGTSGTIKVTGIESGVIEYSQLTGDSIILLVDGENEMRCYTAEKLGFTITGVLE